MDREKAEPSGPYRLHGERHLMSVDPKHVIQKKPSKILLSLLDSVVKYIWHFHSRAYCGGFTMRKIPLFSAVFILLAVSLLAYQPVGVLTGKVGRVLDGETIIVGGHGTVRLCPPALISGDCPGLSCGFCS